MKRTRAAYLSVLAGFSLLLFSGCKGQQPMAPTRAASFDVEMPASPELKAALAGSSKNEILYVVRNPNGIIAKGKFDAATASAADGSFKISLNVLGENSVLSLQLNDAITHQPLAIGAAPMSFTQAVVTGPPIDVKGTVSANKVKPPPTKGKPSLTLNLGSLTNSCSTFSYVASEDLNFYYETPNYDGTNDVYVGFYSGPSETTLGQYMSSYLGDLAIAYLGNGDMVDDAYVPPDSAFYQYSYEAKSAATGASQQDSLFKVGDVYCVKLASYSGAHAWVRITGFPDGVNMSYRVNTSYPFYGWESTYCNSAP